MMMRVFRLPLFYFFSTFFFLTPIIAQNTTAGYRQQQVNYAIDVRLDDVRHELNGNIKIEYTNNSPNTLSFIWFHLWPNAYKNLNTAFARQQLENRQTEFYFSNPEDRGFIDNLDFQVEGKKLEWEYDSVHIDLCKVFLPKPVNSGKTVTITTPFHVKIPESFSRLGHVGQSYQITQWYPKPAVYDNNGWHPMPYLDQGEFYSEFGSFDVKITLPKNYVVGASGNLQNEEEMQWLNNLAEKTGKMKKFEDDKSFPKSDSLSKTLHYKLDNAHDFAWFADKRYHVLKGEVALPHSGKKVTTWAMFTNREADLWKNSLEYINDATYYYSLWIGDYAYDQVTAVEGALSAGGGMEYPTITIIGSSRNAFDLEVVMMHEVGHNWFYGMLGTNERDYPWMDEGINSFYEMRYIQTKYPDRKWLENFKTPAVAKFLDLDSYKQKFQNELFYLYNARQRRDQPIGLHAEDFTMVNYGTIVYSKTAIVFDHLKAYLGDSVFDNIMQHYFDEWKFKHPQPENLRSLFETMTGKNLSWFFDDLIGTVNTVDYKISNVKRDKDNNIHTLRIRNTGEITSPVSISAIRKDTIAKTIWLDGFEGEKVIEIVDEKYRQYEIDALRTTTEFHRKNNNYRMNGMLHKAERLRFQIFGSIENPQRAQLFFTPAMGWNNYDKTLVGIAFYNHFLPFKKFEFELVPMLGTGSVQFAGMGRMGYTFYMKKSKVHNINFNVQGKRFSYDLFPDVLNYNKVQPVLTFEFRNKNPRSWVEKKLSLRNVQVWQEVREYNQEIGSNENVIQHYCLNEASFNWNNSRVINPFDFSLTIQQQQKNFIRTFAEFNYMLTYNSKKKGLFIRLFAGGFPLNNRDESQVPDPRFRMNFSTGTEQFQKDFLFDEYFFGRNETEIFSSQQVVKKDGGFRNRMGGNGQSDNWIAAVNLSSTIPGKIPIRPYISIGGFGENGLDTSGINKNWAGFAFELGLSIVILPDIFEINFPLVSIVRSGFIDQQANDVATQTRKWYIGLNKEDTDNLYYSEKYWSLITFQFNIKKMNPFEVMKKMPF